MSSDFTLIGVSLLERYGIRLIKQLTQSFILLTSLIICSIYAETNSYGIEFGDIPYKREHLFCAA